MTSTVQGAQIATGCPIALTLTVATYGPGGGRSWSRPRRCSAGIGGRSPGAGRKLAAQGDHPFDLTFANWIRRRPLESRLAVARQRPQPAANAERTNAHEARRRAVDHAAKNSLSGPVGLSAPARWKAPRSRHAPTCAVPNTRLIELLVLWSWVTRSCSAGPDAVRRHCADSAAPATHAGRGQERYS